MTSSFLKEPLIIGGQLDAPRATNTAEGIGYATERIAEGFIGGTKDYVMDVLKNYGSAIQDSGQAITGLFSKSERGDNSRLKNMGLGLSGSVVHATRGTTNLALGILGLSDKLYRNGIVDAHSELSAGTVDRLWQPGMGFGNVRRVAAYIGGIPTRTANMIAKWIDTPLDYLQKVTRPANREAYQANLRFR